MRAKGKRLSYCESGEIRLRVTASRPTAFALHLRIPGWSAEEYAPRVHGVEQAVAPRVRAGREALSRWIEPGTVGIASTCGSRSRSAWKLLQTTPIP